MNEQLCSVDSRHHLLGCRQYLETTVGPARYDSLHNLHTHCKMWHLLERLLLDCSL